jgi:anti-sigma regulatory factor (Ser/Thr protein kinase)
MPPIRSVSARHHWVWRCGASGFPLVTSGVHEVSPTLRFLPAPASVGMARDFVRRNLAAWPEDRVDAAILMTSELVTNAVVHARSRGEVSVKVSQATLRIAVRDESKSVPVEVPHAPYDEHGRGLTIVSELAERWGVTENLVGKSVWFTLGANS